MEKTKAFILNYALYIILGVLIVIVIIIEPSFLNARKTTDRKSVV